MEKAEKAPTKFDLAVGEITASLKKTTLKEPLTLDAIHSLVWDRENKTPFNCGAGLIDSFDLQFPLCSRETSLQVLSEVMQHHLSSSEKGRKNHPLPVLAGTPDIGKVFFFFLFNILFLPNSNVPLFLSFAKQTRLLHEVLPRVLEPLLKNNPHFPQHVVQILVTYQNGHGPQNVDRTNPEAAFAWRILHRYFLENRKATTLIPFLRNLEEKYDWEKLTVMDALSLVAEAHRSSQNLSNETPLLIYLGLDEFNKMCSNLCQCKKPDYSSQHVHLRHVIEAIGDFYVEPPPGISLVFCMAGVYLQPLTKISNESGFPLQLIPVSLVSEQLFLKSLLKKWTIDGHNITVDQSWLETPSFRKAITFWSGIPGYAVNFLKRCFRAIIAEKKEINSASDIIRNIQRTLKAEISAKLGVIPYQGLLKIVATSITQTVVVADQEWLPDSPEYGTWAKAQKSGLCLIDNGLVKIPLCYLMVTFFFLPFLCFAHFSFAVNETTCTSK
jgi:hypothetical protein